MICVGHNRETGKRVELPLPGEGGQHWLIAGSSGSGKSFLLRCVLSQLAPMPHTAIVIADPSFMEFDAWRPRASAIGYGREGAEWVLRCAEEELRWRLREGRRLGVRMLPINAELPRLVIAFDELAMLTLGGPKDAMKRLVDLAQVGRKVNMGMILCTQSPKANVVPMLVREQCAGGCRICLRTEEPEQTDAVLGTQHVPAHRLRGFGSGYVELREGGFARIRTPEPAPGQSWEDAVHRYAHLTPTLPASRGWKRLYDPYDADTKSEEYAA